MIRKLLDVIKTFEAEPSSDSDHPEQLVVFVVRGKAKEIAGQHFTQDQVKWLSEKDVEKFFKRYEASLSSKTFNAAMVDTFLQLSYKSIGSYSPLLWRWTSEELEWTFHDQERT